MDQGAGPVYNTTGSTGERDTSRARRSEAGPTLKRRRSRGACEQGPERESGPRVLPGRGTGSQGALEGGRSVDPAAARPPTHPLGGQVPSDAPSCGGRRHHDALHGFPRSRCWSATAGRQLDRGPPPPLPAWASGSRSRSASGPAANAWPAPARTPWSRPPPGRRGAGELAASLGGRPVPVLLVADPEGSPPGGRSARALGAGPWDVVYRNAPIEEILLRVDRLRRQARAWWSWTRCASRSTSTATACRLTWRTFQARLREHFSTMARSTTWP